MRRLGAALAALGFFACGPGDPAPAPVDATTDIGPAPPETAQGTARYRKRIITAAGLAGDEWRPIAGAAVELRRASDGLVLAEGVTAEDGTFELARAGNEPVQVAVVARARGPRVNVAIHGSDTDLAPWTAVSGPGPDFDVDVGEPYLAGAFNVVQLALSVAQTLDGVVPDDVPEPPLLVRWDAELTPGCGSCFFDTGHRLDIWGGAAEEDAHDDSVILHELGHYVEATFGYYTNPTGPHNLEKVRPTLAWSEGFATWFQGVVRGDPLYLDLRPGDIVYSLDLESPPVWVKGSTGDPAEESFRYSEALVYGILWDLSDDPGGALEEEVAFPLADALRDVVRILDDGDIAQVGADLTDFLNRWRCAHPAPSDEELLQGLLDSFEFPYSVEPAPTCPE